MDKHFTATVYVVAQHRILLVFHRKFKKWLAPGGHLNTNETPPEAARREALEETGLTVELLSDENLWINRWNANSFERPYLCLLEEVPAFGSQPAHQHIDMIYVGHPVGGDERLNYQETENMRWFTLEEIEALVPDVDIFAETQQVIRKVLSDSPITCR